MVIHELGPHLHAYPDKELPMATETTILPLQSAKKSARPRSSVPTAQFEAPGSSHAAGAPVPNLTNHGGTVIESVQVVTIYWGAAWSSGANTILRTGVDSFFDFIVTSQLMDMLAEYSIPGKPIRHGSHVASVLISNNEPGVVTPSGRSVTDAQIQKALQGWVSKHLVPAKTPNTLYFIYLPPNCVSVAGSEISCSNVCGFHNVIGNDLYYAVVPFINCQSCVVPGPFLDTLTLISSHELSEAITDPALGTWFDHDLSHEIGDICNREEIRLGPFLVQLEWSNERGACVIKPTFAAQGTSIDGYATDFNKQQHVNFIGTDGHIHEFFFDDEWHHNDLTHIAGAPPVATGGNLDGFQTSFNKQQHVNYIGPEGHIHELFFDTTWQHNDLSVLAGNGPAAAGGSHIDAYQTTFNDQQHVNYIGDDNHVHELFFDNGWHRDDLTKRTKAPPAARLSPLDGYQTFFNKQQHINFLGTDNHVHELFFDNIWKHSDLTTLASAPNAAPNSSIDGYSTEFNRQQHVNYISNDGHVHELFFDNIWKHNDLTVAAGNAPLAASGSQLVGYETVFNQQQHVNYIGIDNHVHELFFTKTWQHSDLTVRAAAPLPITASHLDGYSTEFNQQQHLNYIGADNHIHELFFLNGWHHKDLTVL